jgi:PhnB protein
MLTIEPYLTFNGTCRQAIEFYQSALGAKVLFSQTFGDSPMAEMAGPSGADLIMHATLEIEGSKIMMSDDPAPGPPTDHSNVTLAIGLHDPARAQQLFDNLAAGGKVTMPLEKTFWAEKFGMLTDKFGIPWMINSEAPR